MVGQTKFCLCRQFYFLPPPTLVVVEVRQVVTAYIPVKSGWTTGGENSEEGIVRASERWARVYSLGTSFFSLGVRMKVHATEGKLQLRCNSIPELLVFKFNPIMVLHGKFDIPLEGC